MGKQVRTFKGVPITELTHEELLAAYDKVAQMLEEERESHIQYCQVQQELDDAIAKIRRTRGWEWR